ncbi:imidazole glycerol phosphate synthase subunit HisH [Bacillus alkalisoli]|uniref:imidazole glycerol phosphate synthase subunit HisH n=1 Tax=Bacillus alkalisoli TaxID=2011008 RepID=UPI000C240630|nr:imidazole glycerol phosphate synthase subunit HisH [Bacillus alkalisoli]
MIGIIDYGMGNLFSVSKALERIGVPYFISQDIEELTLKADGLLLPGVGSFKDAMAILNETGLADYIRSEVKKKPLLGICLGMQLLFQKSEENGLSEGLGLLEGEVVKFPGITSTGDRYKVPHMGWNHLTVQKPSPLLTGVPKGHVYFVHSYYVKMEKTSLLASCQYNVEVPAIVGGGNVYGTQFHPEKSSDVGMTILRNFATIVADRKGESCT